MRKHASKLIILCGCQAFIRARLLNLMVLGWIP